MIHVQDIIDLVVSAKNIGVTVETLLIPATEFADFRQELENFQKNNPDLMKELAGVRMLQHYPTLSKYNSVADKIQTIREFYSKTISGKHDVDTIVYNYFGIDRTLLAEEQALANRNMGKTDESH